MALSRTRVLATVLVVVLVVVVLAVFAVWITGPTKTSTTYQPVGVVGVARLMSTTTTPEQAYCNAHPKGCITWTRASYSFKPLTIPDAGAESCFQMNGRSESGNKLIDDIVDGTVSFHGCTRDGVHVSRVWLTWDHHESWLWTFDGMRVVDSHGGWCNECFSEFHHWSLQFAWHKGINVLGQELYWHHTGGLACTFYVSAYSHGRWACG